VLGEGAAIIILESLDSALKRGVHIYAEIAGFGSNCGAYHMVTPDPSGVDAVEVMKAAIEDAEIVPQEVDYISAHGTSTKQNDIVETRAIKALFGKRAYRIPISSVKSMIGHTIGAAGAMGAVVCCLALQNKILPPTINLRKPDPECDLDYISNVSRKAEVRNVLSNSFGFGSNNASLLFRESRGEG
jgi:3-oxoacyl-(acyl-carrier-protein) synthase